MRFMITPAVAAAVLEKTQGAMQTHLTRLRQVQAQLKT